MNIVLLTSHRVGIPTLQRLLDMGIRPSKIRTSDHNTRLQSNIIKNMSNLNWFKI